MNTVMPPMQPNGQGHTEDFRRGHELLHIKRRDAGGSGDDLRGSSSGDRSGGGNGSGSGSGGPKFNANSDSDSDSDNSGNVESNGSGDGSNNLKDSHDPPPKPTPNSDPHTTPTIIVVTSTTSTSSSSSTSPALTISQPTAALITSAFPSTFTSTADTSSEPRKGLTDPTSTTTSKTKTKTTSKSATALAATAAPTSVTISDQSSIHHSKNNVSPLAEHLLIAAGVIGFLIMILAAVYFIFQVKKTDTSALFRNRYFRKRENGGGYKFWRNDKHPIPESPPRYTGLEKYYGKRTEEKNIPDQRQLDAFFTPVVMPPLAKTGAALSRADSQRQALARDALLDNPAPFGYSAPQQYTASATEDFYGDKMGSLATKPELQLSRQPSNNTVNTGDTQSSTQSVQLSRQPSDPYSNTTNIMSIQTSSQNVEPSRSTLDTYGPAPREATHMSYLSSLSSGFGDGLMIPEESTLPNVNARYTPAHSRNPTANRFSWATSVPIGHRDTVYTNTSVESAPRFRSINSWVAHQTSHVERKRQIDKEIPDMPDIPRPLRMGGDHQRNPSENPAFMHHPGEEFVISRGSRVPSEILDKKIGVIRR